MYILILQCLISHQWKQFSNVKLHESISSRVQPLYLLFMSALYCQIRSPHFMAPSTYFFNFFFIGIQQLFKTERYAATPFPAKRKTTLASFCKLFQNFLFGEWRIIGKLFTLFVVQLLCHYRQPANLKNQNRSSPRVILHCLWFRCLLIYLKC